MNSKLIESYFRMDKLPHIWCPGCGNGIVTRALVQAIDNLKLHKDDVCIVSGIGCSSRAAGYLDFNTLHTTHGRALAFATGIKLAKPHLEVIVVTGDGDCTAIGGNHLIHAARRNIGITTIVYNNSIYGMTGGQYSPTTPFGDRGTTAPYGNFGQPFDLVELAGAAGATYTARSTVYHTVQLAAYIQNAIAHKGFSLVEAVSICPTYYGRKNHKGSPAEMMEWLRDTYTDVGTAYKLSAEQLAGKQLMGEFRQEHAPEYTEEYARLIRRHRKENPHE